MDAVTVYLDESGNGSPAHPLVVCGIALENERVSDFQKKIRSSYRRMLAQTQFRSDADRERFKRTGFHRSHDLLEVQVEFTRLLTSTSIYKALLIATDRSTLVEPDGAGPMAEVDQLVELYVRLGGVLRRQFRQSPRIDLVVERNEPLLPRMDEIRDRINSRRNAHGRHLPPVMLAQADKAPDSILAAADGLAHIAAGWLKKDRETNAKAFEYRAYAETEAAISWFCSLEHGVVSTRRVRHSGLPSSGTGAASVPLAIPHASAPEQLLSARSRAPHALDPDLVSNLDSFAAHLHTEPADLEQLADEVAQGQHYSPKVIHVGKRPRLIVRPNLQYGTITKELNRLLIRTSTYEAPPHVFGFIHKRSIRDNARAHLAQDCVLRLDIHRFFESIDRSRVAEALWQDGAASDVAELICKLAAPRGELATGLSTSPHLSNLVFQQTDHDLVELSRQLGLTFTRYVDDLTFSGSIDDSIADQLREVIRANGWTINERKTRFMRRGHAQYVTGLSVSDRAAPHAPRRLKRAMRWRLHIIEKYGYDAYMDRFGGSDLAHYPSRLRGTARYLFAQEPGLGPDFLERWNKVLPDFWHEDEYADYVYEGVHDNLW